MAHRLLLNIAISWSKLTVFSFSKVSHHCLFYNFVEILRTKCHLQRLAKKIVKWFNETGGKGKEFNYRFTGKDSRLFLQNFMYIIDILEGAAKNQQVVLLIYVHAYLCLCLQDAVSLFSRVNTTDKQVCNLKSLCTDIYRGYCLYLSNVTPTLWSLGNLVPQHTEEMKAKYGLGLGLNSMEGREAKRVAISKYSANTAHLFQWEQIFRHEYISLIWLRQQGYNAKITTPSTTRSYIPKRVSSKNPEFCYCGFNKAVSDEFCRFCGHELRMKIKKSLEDIRLFKSKVV